MIEGDPKPQVVHAGIPESEELDELVRDQHAGEARLADVLKRLAASGGTDQSAIDDMEEIYPQQAGADAGPIPEPRTFTPQQPSIDNGR